MLHSLNSTSLGSLMLVHYGRNTYKDSTDDKRHTKHLSFESSFIIYLCNLSGLSKYNPSENDILKVNMTKYKTCNLFFFFKNSNVCSPVSPRSLVFHRLLFVFPPPSGRSISVPLHISYKMSSEHLCSARLSKENWWQGLAIGFMPLSEVNSFLSASATITCLCASLRSSQRSLPSAWREEGCHPCWNKEGLLLCTYVYSPISICLIHVWKLARKYHPDTNPDKGAQEKFVEIQHAYDVSRHAVSPSLQRPEVLLF